MLYEKLLKELNSYREDVEMLILQNEHIEDFETYQYYTGKLKGINDSIEIVRETFKRSNNE